jgi:hypothetical protein
MFGADSSANQGGAGHVLLALHAGYLAVTISSERVPLGRCERADTVNPEQHRADDPRDDKPEVGARA